MNHKRINVTTVPQGEPKISAGFSYNKKEAKRIQQLLLDEFLNLKRYTISDIVERFLPTSNILHVTIAEKRVRGWMRSIQKNMWKKHNIMFGNINDQGQYGIADTDGEYVYAQTNRLIMAKTLIKNYIRYGEEAQKNGLSIETKRETFSLPTVRLND